MIHGQEEKLKKVIKFPALMPRNSKCDQTNDGFDTIDTHMPTGFQGASKADTLPNISLSDKLIVKKVAFEDGIYSVIEANSCKEDKNIVLRLPNIQDSASNMSTEDRRFEENSPHRNDDSSLDSEQGTESHFSKKCDVKANNLLIKNYEFQHDLRFSQSSQKLSRTKYSYFPRFSSPAKPMNKREKLKKRIGREDIKETKGNYSSGKPWAEGRVL